MVEALLEYTNDTTSLLPAAADRTADCQNVSLKNLNKRGRAIRHCWLQQAASGFCCTTGTCLDSRLRAAVKRITSPFLSDTRCCCQRDN